MLVFTSHALKPLHLNVCPSSTARNTARSSSSLSDKSTSTLIRLKTHSAMHFHNFLHNFFFIQQQHTGGALHPPGLQLPPNSNREHRLPPRLVLDERSVYLQCYSMGLFIILVVHIRDQPQIIIAAAHKHRHSVIVRRSSWRCRRCKKKENRPLFVHPVFQCVRLPDIHRACWRSNLSSGVTKRRELAARLMSV